MAQILRVNATGKTGSSRTLPDDGFWGEKTGLNAWPGQNHTPQIRDSDAAA
jgi:hypothetical protein